MGAASELQCRLADGELRLLLDPSFLFNCAAAGQGALAVLIGAVLATLAWLAKGLVSGLLAWRRRRRDRMAILAALAAGIEGSADGYRRHFDDAARERLIERTRTYAQTGRVLAPYWTTAPDFVLARIRDRISLVPPRLVVPVTRYIYLSDLLDAAAADFRSTAYAELAADRKIAQIRIIFDVAQETAALGEDLAGGIARQVRIMRGIDLAGSAVVALLVLWGLRWALSSEW